jgi:hypothetical protein
MLRGVLDGELHRSRGEVLRMRAMLSVVVGLSAGCTQAESRLEPRVPVNAQLVDHTKMRAPDIQDGFPRVFEMAAEVASPPEHVRSISLGFIGDGKLGTEPTPQHHEPYWARPFPCHWTNTCRMVPACAVRPGAVYGMGPWATP